MTDPNDQAAPHPHPAPEPMPELEQGDLPNGWMETTLGEVVGKLVDGSHNPPKASDTGKPMLSARNIQQRKILFDDFRLIPDADFEHENRRTEIAANDVLLTIVGAIGRTAVVPQDLQPFTLQRSVAVLKPTATESRLLSYFLEAPEIQKFFEANAKGTAQKGIYLKALAETPFPLPPLPEQIRIANKLDTLLARVEAGRERLARMPALLARLRQSILSAAVSGELTREWRGGGDAEWEEVTLGDLLESLRNGISAKPSEDATGRPILKISSVRPFSVTTEQGRFVPLTDEEFERFGLRLDDLLVTRYNGSLELVGIGGLVRNPEILKFTYPDKLMRLRLKETALPAFVEIVLNAPFIRKIVEGLAKTTSGQTGISGQDLKALQIPLPPLPEQAEIVRRVELLFARVDALERQYQAAARHFDTLTPALLQKAFRGELVPQDPADEPASVLLERIRAVRAAEAPTKRGRGTGRKPRAEDEAAGKDQQASKRRGRPRKAAAAEIPTAASFEDAVRHLETAGGKRAAGTRQPGLFEGEG